MKGTSLTNEVDIATIQYNWDSLVLMTYLKHRKSRAFPQTHTFYSRSEYVYAGRVLRQFTSIDHTPEQLSIENIYNETGQLIAGSIGTNNGGNPFESRQQHNVQRQATTKQRIQQRQQTGSTSAHVCMMRRLGGGEW
jgi:hypothetical protein